MRAEIGYGEKVWQRLWSKKLEEEIGLTAGHKDAERLEGRRVFELERVVSCRRAYAWWRTKLNFGGGESFDDLHRSTAFRAAPKRVTRRNEADESAIVVILFPRWLNTNPEITQRRVHL